MTMGISRRAFRLMRPSRAAPQLPWTRPTHAGPYRTAGKTAPASFLGSVAFCVRTNLDETPVFEEEVAEADEVKKLPAGEVALLAGTASDPGRAPTPRSRNPMSPVCGPSASSETPRFQEKT
jgi:hypothetical protein